MGISFNNNVKKETKTKVTEPKKVSETKIQQKEVIHTSNISTDPSILLPKAINVAEKINKIGEELKEIIVERDDVIDSLLVAIATKNHAVMLGVPGTAKSLLTREICKRIVGGTYFEWLLNRTSDPSEILGPFSLKSLENDEFERHTKGKLPEADIVFLDEIFKCNEPVLNSLLTILNERKFHNNGKLHDIPLISLIGASNEEPDDDSLDALYDRLLFRFRIDPIKDTKNRLDMYNNYINRRNPSNTNKIVSTVEIEELDIIAMAAKFIAIPIDVRNRYDALLTELWTKHKIRISDRRKNEGLGILQGSAILNQREVVSVDDFEHLIPVWWQREEDIPVIKEMIYKVMNPYKAKILEHKDNVNDILDRIKKLEGEEKQSEVCKAKELFNTILKDLNKIKKAALKDGKDTEEIEDFAVFVNKKSKELLASTLKINADLDDIDGLDDLIDID
jgi:MoxR-like ATPase